MGGLLIFHSPVYLKTRTVSQEAISPRLRAGRCQPKTGERGVGWVFALGWQPNLLLACRT